MEWDATDQELALPAKGSESKEKKIREKEHKFETRALYFENHIPESPSEPTEVNLCFFVGERKRKTK
jgi:hypothetical protein